jgi:metal-responsive CopG/Arc/MetJ family transcriptional regulator
MKDYGIVEFLTDKDKLRIQIDLPKYLIKILDDYVMFKANGSRKRLIELILIKYILEIEKDLY